MNYQTLRPGLLITLKTGISGNTEYRRNIIEEDHDTDEGTRRARWETERTVMNPAERKKASQIRSQCRSLISRLCTSGTFTLCPEDKKDELDAAIKEANKMVADFNESATLTRVHFYIICGYIAASDAEATRAVNSEVRTLLADMEKGIARLDVKMIREAAAKAKSIGQMLTPEASDRIKMAVETAREIARAIKKAGEEAAVVINRNAVRKIIESRTMFLDLDEAPASVSAPVVTARAVEFDPAPVQVEAAPKKRARGAQPQLEL